jgi:predicted CXXCH cytochrome family protein
LLETASLPSGIEVKLGSGNSLCATCHSGTSSGATVDETAAGFDADEIMAEAGFVNPHYAFAAATWLGAEGEGGYQYDGKTYAARFEHAAGVQSCTECHDPHSLHMREDYESEAANLCAACHSNVSGYTDYREVYVDGIDYDGNGKVEGLYHEIEGMRSVLYRAMQQYSAGQTENAILWADQYPYWYIDTNQDGEVNEGEAEFANQFSGFTPRLMRAAFNFQFSAKDPAGYVHNGQYMLQLLYDSIEDLAAVVDVDMSALVRPD